MPVALLAVLADASALASPMGEALDEDDDADGVPDRQPGDSDAQGRTRLGHLHRDRDRHHDQLAFRGLTGAVGAAHIHAALAGRTNPAPAVNLCGQCRSGQSGTATTSAAIPVFNQRVEGTVLDFGTAGKLRDSDLVMYDRQTESWWHQLSGEALVGTLAGTKLRQLPGRIVSWRDFRRAHPSGLVQPEDRLPPRVRDESLRRLRRHRKSPDLRDAERRRRPAATQSARRLRRGRRGRV